MGKIGISFQNVSKLLKIFKEEFVLKSLVILQNQSQLIERCNCIVLIFKLVVYTKNSNKMAAYQWARMHL